MLFTCDFKMAAPAIAFRQEEEQEIGSNCAFLFDMSIPKSRTQKLISNQPYCIIDPSPATREVRKYTFLSGHIATYINIALFW